MDQERVTEVWVPGKQAQPGWRGSGYMLANDLVLTCYHVVQGLRQGDSADVRPFPFNDDSWMTAQLCWPVDPPAKPTADIALLKLDDAQWRHEPLPGKIRFGEVPAKKKVQCLGLGFTAAEMRPDNRSDTMRIAGHTEPGGAIRSGMLTIRVDDGIVPGPLDDGPAGRTSGWAGASGTALFCGHLLIGVLASARDIAVNPDVLSAVPASALEKLPGFTEVLAAHGIDLQLEPAPAHPYEEWLGPYLQAVIKAAREHPQPGVLSEENLPPLAAVYLRQNLDSVPDEKRISGASRGPAGAGIVAASGVLAGSGSALIIGLPGSGKSSLLHTLAADLAICQNPPSQQIPVLIQAADLVKDPYLTLAEALAKAAVYGARMMSNPPPEDFFASSSRDGKRWLPPWPGTRWVAFIDGLDEVSPGGRRKQLLQYLDDLQKKGYQIIAATRPGLDDELDVLPAAARYTLQRFTLADVQALAASWFTALRVADPYPRVADPEADATRLLDQVTHTGLADLARLPLIATMLCQLPASDPGRLLPPTRGGIYEEFLDASLRRRAAGTCGLAAQAESMSRYSQAAKDAAGRVVSELDDLLGHLAAERLRGNTTPYLDLAKSVHPVPPTVPRKAWDTFLGTALSRSGLFTPRDGFLHQSTSPPATPHAATRDFSSGN